MQSDRQRKRLRTTKGLKDFKPAAGIVDLIAKPIVGRTLKLIQWVVDLKPIIAVTVGIAIFRGIVSPLVMRYLTWRNGPRELVARRNWRGVYVPDLTVTRAERAFWIAYLAFVVIAGAVGWTIMVPA